jgi:hypothetical protein|tara:strand:+ start:365 stop:562 length:198 start_codon:yes stop_codon:yes gene_type:complete
MSSVSLFEQNKPRKTYQAIKELIVKYDKITNETVIMEEEDCTRIEMANDFSNELRQVMKIFKSGE